MTSTSVSTPHTNGQPLKSVELTWDQVTTGHFPTNGKETTPIRSDNEAVQPKPATTGWQNHEPPFLHSVKWRDPEIGIEHLTVIRANDLDELMLKVKTVTHMVKITRQKHQLTQQDKDETDSRQTPEGWCDVHRVQMTPSKDGRGYYHKAGVKPDGKAIWCRGR